jgi:NADPH-dependent 2,4-dienoyl-CoA reductase/sulfur reductase-like enzyme
VNDYIWQEFLPPVNGEDLMKIVIVGGVAGGASAAARARRLSEDVSIVVLERGSNVSFANCGLPYHIGGKIPLRQSLILKTPEDFKSRFNIDVRIYHEVTSVDPVNKTVTVKNLTSGRSIAKSGIVCSSVPAPLRLSPFARATGRGGLYAAKSY